MILENHLFKVSTVNFRKIIRLEILIFHELTLQKLHPSADKSGLIEKKHVFLFKVA